MIFKHKMHKKMYFYGLKDGNAEKVAKFVHILSIWTVSTHFRKNRTKISRSTEFEFSISGPRPQLSENNF